MSRQPSSSPVLSEIDRKQYEDAGILFPVVALESTELEGYRTAIDSLEALMGEVRASWVSQCHLHFRWAYQLSTHHRILDAVEQVIGPDILVHSSTLFSKHPRTDSFVSWHQDGHYWGLSEPRLVSAWIALTDSTPENGCMRVLPGSHSRQLDHFEQRDENNMLASGLTVTGGFGENCAVDVILKAGEMSLHHANLVHGSNPNRSPDKRIGFAVRFVAPGVTQSPVHHNVVLARGRDDYNDFRKLDRPPNCGIREGLAKQIEFAQRLQRERSTQGRLG